MKNQARWIKPAYWEDFKNLGQFSVAICTRLIGTQGGNERLTVIFHPGWSIGAEGDPPPDIQLDLRSGLRNIQMGLFALWGPHASPHDEVAVEVVLTGEDTSAPTVRPAAHTEASFDALSPPLFVEGLGGPYSFDAARPRRKKLFAECSH